MGNVMRIMLILLVFPAVATCFERGMLNLRVPYTEVETGSLELRVDHRFYGEAFGEDPFEDFFGMDVGANVGVDLRLFPWRRLDVRLGHVRSGSRYLGGIGWSQTLPFRGMETYAYLGFKSLEIDPVKGREGDFVGLITLTSGPFWNRLVPIVGYCYDGYSDRGGPGIGLDVELVDKLSVTGEFFPVLDREEEGTPSDILAEDAFSFGIRATTWGHQFIVALSNSQGIGMADQLSGTAHDGLFLGFSIRRMFSF
ncbi:hypothetical protein GF402_11120 [Candidatus Fermentibacteria bacterium]|nr:hypothetical protein [Candidatus Fermentibacteria bacterium]